jgi:MFS family permease
MIPEIESSNLAIDTEISKHFRHNLAVNIMDGGFFGFALGFASFATVLPLFVSTMTESAILIGLIPAVHQVGWQLPQLFTAGRVARLSRYKPMVIVMTIHERVPFLGLAGVAWFLPVLGRESALLLTFGLLIWQGLGGGFAGTAWQSMIGKIIPARQRGTFFGAQAAAFNLCAAGTAVIAGMLLERLGTPRGFTACFLAASICMAISWIFLAMTREPTRSPIDTAATRPAFWNSVGAILKRDVDFRWFLVMRMLAQLAMIASAFYTVYAVRHLGVSEGDVGLMTGVLLATQIGANPIMGWLGDRWSHRAVLEVGALAAAVSALMAWWAPGASWFYLVFSLAGIANVAFWTIGLAMTLEFGTEVERPTYIGLANTLVAPVTIIAPILGGWLADAASYQTAFLASAAGGVVTTLVLHMMVRDPRHVLNSKSTSTASGSQKETIC